jgi:hypothetical protein
MSLARPASPPLRMCRLTCNHGGRFEILEGVHANEAFPPVITKKVSPVSTK